MGFYFFTLILVLPFIVPYNGAMKQGGYYENSLSVPIPLIHYGGGHYRC
jgi:pilus assembly protein TadC